VCLLSPQIAYEAWATSSKAALDLHKKEENKMKNEEKRRAKRELQRQQGKEGLVCMGLFA
jgi:hypothetical protein